MRQRIRTMVEVALADRNYLFGLPPMLDAQPVPGRATAGWIRRYGHTLEGCTSGPWTNSVFKGNVVFLHILDWPQEGVRLAAIPRGLVSSASVTGDVQVRQDAEGWMLTGRPDSIDTIVRLEFDRPVEEIAYGLPSKGSLTEGRERTVTTDPEGRMVAEVNLGGEREVGRFEFTIHNPGYMRGEGRPFQLLVRQSDRTWTTVYEGKVFGTICSKAIGRVRANAVRLVVQASGISQFDVF